MCTVFRDFYLHINTTSCFSHCTFMRHLPKPFFLILQIISNLYALKKKNTEYQQNLLYFCYLKVLNKPKEEKN